MVKRIVLTIMTIFVMASIFSTVSDAHTITNTVNVNDTFKSSDGSSQRVIKVNADGTFVTENVNLDSQRKATLSLQSNCKHTSFTVYGVTYIEKKFVNTKDVCYKTRKWRHAKCASCKKTGFRVYLTDWKYHKHDYGFLGLGKTCDECGRKK